MIRLSDTALDPSALLAAVADGEHGASALFVGTTRAEAGDRAVTALDYEAYDELALSEMVAIAAEAEHAFGACVSLEHRVGRVPVGEASVVVAASAGHRPAAFAACRYVIDELKARVPIWKRTAYADGGAAWVDGAAAGHTTTARSHHA